MKSAVRGDVQLPLAELLHLALLLAYHHRDAGLTHPVDLPFQVDRLLLVGRLLPLRRQLLNALVPVAIDQGVHPHACHLVDADQHCLAGLPGLRVVVHEVPCHLVEPTAGGDDVVLASEFLLQALRHVDVLHFDLLEFLGNSLVQVVDGDPQRVAAGVVVQRHGGAVFHRALEVVGRDVRAEDPPRDLVFLEQGRAGEADAGGVRQRVAHVERQRAVLGAVRLVGDDDDVVAFGVGRVGVHVSVELLDEREDVRLVRAQQPAQMLAAFRPAGVSVVVRHAAAGEGLVDLGVEVVAVGQHQEREVAAELAVHLPGEHHHRVALARPLGVPEHAEPALQRLALAHRLDGAVHAEELVVAGQDLLQLVCRLVEDDEVLHQIHEVALVADALEQRLHVDRARLLLGEALPCVEVLPAAGDRADLRLLAVAEHHYRIVVEEMGNGVAVVRVVSLEGGLEVPVDVLALDEQQRKAVDEADDVRPPPVEAAAYPELPHAEKVVVRGVIEVEDPESLVHQLALGVTERHPNACAHQRGLLPVGGGDALRGGGLDDLPYGVVVGGIGETRIQGHELHAHQARQYDFAVGSAAEQAVRPEVLVVVRVDRFPAEPLFHVLGGGLLDERVFGVG